MKRHHVQDCADVRAIFEGLLAPLTTADDTQDVGTFGPRSQLLQTFVVNYQAGRDLCCLLEPQVFMAFSTELQARILSLLDLGLAAGICSAIRLRISCESNQGSPRLIWKLLGLLKELAAQTERDSGLGLDNNLQVLGRVLGMVCSAGIRVDELKAILREFRVPSATTPPLLAALVLMVPATSSNNSAAKGFGSQRGEHRRSIRRPWAVPSMFNFSGEGAGVILPSLLWPFPQEYQIAAWVRIEPSPKSVRRKSHLITLTTSGGAGVDFYLQDSDLFVAVADGRGGGHVRPTVDIGEVGFIHGEWKRLVIWHKRSSTLLFNKDQLEVFVDEKLVFSSPVPYPRHITEPLTQCSVGTDFDGQMSGVLLLSVAADIKVVGSMLNGLAGRTGVLGRGATRYEGFAADPDLWADPATVSTQERLRRTLLGSQCRIFAALLPGRTINGRCLEPHNGHHARLRAGKTHVWITSSAQDVIRSIGGAPALVTLAHHLLSESPWSSISAPDPNPFTGQNVDTVLSVLLSFLNGSVSNQHDFFLAGGVEILELVLRSASRKTFTSTGSHTVMVLEALFDACHLHQVSAAINRREYVLDGRLQPKGSSLEHQVLIGLLTNFSLWARAPPQLQFGLATSLLDLVRDAPERCRPMVSVGEILRSIRDCCPHRITRSDLTGSRDWDSMSRRERLHMRSFLWEVARLLLGAGVSRRDGDALCRFVAGCDDTRLVCELVQLLGSLMRRSVPPAGLFLALEKASLGYREVGPVSTRTPLQSGFLALVLQRCVLSDGASEDLRAAGLRAANVFMARSAKISARNTARGIATMERRHPQYVESEVADTGFIKLGDSMSAKVSCVFPIVSEALVQYRHDLGEPTYVALLEMALLGDERELPWSEQLRVIGIVNAVTAESERQTRNSREREEGMEEGSEDEEISASVWWNHHSRDPDEDMVDVQVLDDTQRIRNILPLGLILQYLPAMESSVQVRSHGDLLSMLKLNESNRGKIIELSHANGDRFWGVWERCLFLMMAPLFARPIDGIHSELDEKTGDICEGRRKGDYFMVLKLYAMLLEHTLSSDPKGHEEVGLAASLQSLIPHGRIAARILLAQLAFNMGEQSTPGRQSRFKRNGRTGSPSGLRRDSVHSTGEQLQGQLQPRWDNVVNLAFIAANIVSDDVSTVSGGLFPEGADFVREGGFSRAERSLGSEDAAIRACAASTSVPVLLCSSPAEDGSIALSVRVLSMFKVLYYRPSSALQELCVARSAMPNQGLLVFPLLRLSLFLLARLHPLSKCARENVSRLAALTQCLLSDEWQTTAGSDAEGSDDVCIVILVHIYAALLRLKVQATTVGGIAHATISEARTAVAGKGGQDHLVLPHAMSAATGYDVSSILLGVLRCVVRRKVDLIVVRLGERLTTALVDAANASPRDAVSGGEGRRSPRPAVEQSDNSRLYWYRLLQSLRWMESNYLFASANNIAVSASHGGAALLDACMPSLKAAEERESRAVQAGRERAQQWEEVVKRSSAVAANHKRQCFEGGSGQQVVEGLEQAALKFEALRGVREKGQALAARRRLNRCMDTLSAAWSPWSAGGAISEECEPPGWEISSHKDQRMRQMLLIPIDRDVHHRDATFAGTNAGPENPSQDSPEDDAHRDAARDVEFLNMPALKPSEALLAGEVGFVDDDEESMSDDVGSSVGPESLAPKEMEGEELMSDGVESSIGPESLAPRESEGTSKEWEDISRPVALQAEIDAAVQSLVTQQAWENLQLPTSSRGGGGRVFRDLQGKWRATNVLRHASIPGTLYVFERTIVFQGDSNASEDSDESKPALPTRHGGQIWRWQLQRLTQLHLRRFLLSPQAVELFWADSPEVFLAFEDVNDRQAFTRIVRRRHLPMVPAITRRGTLHPRKVFRASRLTELWRRRQISNFQYIMELNVVAGRSYNDITQYPVFPWVLQDYTSPELDLSNPTSFRDLSKPMGALNERRREAFVERYESFDDDMVPKFMYGTHYSSAGVVLHYHVRQDPFTTLHINLQDGRFDCPDRLFGDLGQCWKGCVDPNSMSDVKELTPEFFYCPEIFVNSNKLPLGEMQAGKGVVDNVRLPPWAKDAYDFVRIHRLALESEQVSQHLHKWIDLVFGYKQRGQEAVKAANVFYYLTYEGAVDLSQVNDPRQREAMETQIRHFGQTPSQLLMEPHPVRLPPEECVLPLFSPTSSLASLRVFSPQYWPNRARRRAALLVHCTEDRLICVDAALRVTTWTWSGLPDGRGLPFTLGLCRTNTLASAPLHMSNVSTNKRLPVRRVKATDSSLNGTAQANPVSESIPFPLEWSRWPSMASITRMASSSELDVDSVHDTGGLEAPDPPARSIGCVHSCFGLHAASEGRPDSILSCGYWDHVVRLHSLDPIVRFPLEASGTGGHQGAITCLSIADGSSLLVTGGQDATCRVWVVDNPPVASTLGGSGVGTVDSTNSRSSGDAMVCVHVLYGHEAPLTCLAVSEELDAIVSGASDGRIVVHCLKDGCYVRQYFCGLSTADSVGSPVPEASQLAFSCHGDVVVHSWTDLSLHRFSLNGARLATAVAPTAMSCLLTAGGGEYLLAGGQDGLIRVYTLHDLCVVHTIELQARGGVTCMQLSPNDEYLLAGSEDGEVSIITDARRRLRMLDLALQRAFVG